MEQKQHPKNPAQHAGQYQPGKQAQAGQRGNQPGKQGQPGLNPNRNEEFPGKAPDVYSDRNKDRAENPDAARKQGSQNDNHRSRDSSRQ